MQVLNTIVVQARVLAALAATGWLWLGASAQAARPEPANSWFAGDMHVHRSCGGAPVTMASISNAMVTADLSVVSLLADMGNGEVQNPATDLPLVNGTKSASSPPGRILQWDAEWHWDATYFQFPHQALGGHLVALGLTNAAQVWSEYTYPIFQWAHQRTAVAGFAHLQYLPNYSFPTTLDCCLPIEYPVEVALGSCDFISQDVAGADSAMFAYYRLLNCGFRPGWAGGSDYPCNSSIGAVMTFVQVTNGLTYRKWVDGIAAGRTVVSRNGRSEFLDLKVNTNSTPGDTINLPAGGGAVQVKVTWTAIQNVSGTLEIVHNGNVVASQAASIGLGSSNTLTTTVTLTNSGWVAARRMGNGEHRVHTAAVFVTVTNAPIRASVADALFYVNWMDELLTRTSPGGVWASYFSTNRVQAQSRYSSARAVYLQIASEAAALQPPVITSTNLPAGVPGVFYNTTLTGFGGVSPYTWSLASGQLPGGLTLASSTGVISGSPVSNGVFNFTARLTDSAVPSNTATQVFSISISNNFPPLSIWSNADVPETLADPDGKAAAEGIELGVRFRSLVSGRVTGVRFYKGGGNTGTHTGHLWSTDGTLLAALTFSNETATGWQQQLLGNPFTIQSNVTYVVSYHAPNGHYAADSGYFNGQSVTNYPLWAPRDGLFGANGIYKYGASSFPTNTYNATHYWVDVVFQPDVPPTAQDLNVAAWEDTSTNLMLAGSSAVGAVTYALVSNPTNGTLGGFDTNTGALAYTPAANYSGPDAFRYKVISGGLSATGLVSLTVMPVNDAPVFATSPTNRTIAEFALLTVTNNATDGDLPVPTLTYTLINPPAGAVVTTNGVITWTPGEAQGPSTNDFVTVVNDGVVSVTNSFQVVVVEVNVGPVFAATPPNRTISEFALVTVTNNATDDDLPAQTLIYTLLNPPAGAVVASNGAITWTPNEMQGPSTNQLVTVVSDGLVSVTNSFQVVVMEVNTAPQFTAPPTNVTLKVGAQLAVSNPATDVDWPANILTYQLVDPPVNAGVSAAGLITWVPELVQAPSTNWFLTVVNDGVDSVTNSFMVTVLAPLVPPVILGIEVVDGLATVTWSAVAGHTYQLEYTGGCQATNWVAIPPSVVATGPTLSVTNALEAAPGARFYRVRSTE